MSCTCKLNVDAVDMVDETEPDADHLLGSFAGVYKEGPTCEEERDTCVADVVYTWTISDIKKDPAAAPDPILSNEANFQCQVKTTKDSKINFTLTLKTDLTCKGKREFEHGGRKFVSYKIFCSKSDHASGSFQMGP